MPRRQNTNRKIVSKGKPKVKAFRAPSPSPCSVWSLFPFGGRSRQRTRACARTHMQRPLRGPLGTVLAPGSVPGPGYEHAAFPSSLAAAQPQGANLRRMGRTPTERRCGKSREGHRDPWAGSFGETRCLQWGSHWLEVPNANRAARQGFSETWAQGIWPKAPLHVPWAFPSWLQQQFLLRTSVKSSSFLSQLALQVSIP